MPAKGYFDDDRREYVLEDMFPLRPLKNFLWNESMLLELDQFGMGPSKACIDKQFRTVVCGERVVYVKDRDSGEFFDINRNFARKPFDVFRARIGQGYHCTESACTGISASFTLLVPKEDFVEMHRILLRNDGEEVRRLSLYAYVQPFVNLTGVDACGRAEFREDLRGIYYTYRAFRHNNPYTDVFYAADQAADAYELTADAFFGRYGTLQNPEGLSADRLSAKQTVFEPRYAAVLQFDIELAPGEEKSVYLAAGTARSPDECVRLAGKYADRQAFEREMLAQREIANAYADRLSVSLPDSYLNRMTNVWLKRQMALGKTWGRVYGKGFRDVLQDLSGFVSLEARAVRERLLNALQYQFISGNAIRMFDPILDYPYQDMPVWIPMAVGAYLKETGDFSFLKEEIPYYDDERKESVFCHMKRGIDYLFSHQGRRGLGLWGGGDWNDSLDNCGMQGKGESVWLSIATVKAAEEYLEIAEQADRENCDLSDLPLKIERLKGAIRRFGWDGDHFIYGYNDWDEKVGAEENREGKIFLNVQTWAVMTDILSLEEKRALMDTVERRLKCPYGYLQNDPPYETPDDHLGRLTYFSKGVYENGSVYNHGVMFKVVADCCIGRGEAAWETLKMIRFDNPLNPESGVEPYAICNMYFGPSAPAKKGFAPQGWITGSAGWMYRAITQYMLGIRADFDGLIVRPCLPAEWKEVSAVRVFRGATYRIRYVRSGHFALLADGLPLKGDKVPLFSGGVHEIVCYC